jgi:hypothetical protein
MPQKKHKAEEIVAKLRQNGWRSGPFDRRDAVHVLPVCHTSLRQIVSLGGMPEIFTRLSWNALVLLASPTLPAATREALERRIVAPEIRRACVALKAGKRGPQPEPPGQRMAA